VEAPPPRTLSPIEAQVISKIPSVSYKGIQGGISSELLDPSESKSQNSTTILAELDVSIYELIGPSSSTAFQDSVGLRASTPTSSLTRTAMMTSVPTPTPALKPTSKSRKRKVEKKDGKIEEYMQEMISSSKKLIDVIQSLALSADRIATSLEQIAQALKN